MRINLQKYSFRFAEQVLNSKLALKQEIEDTLLIPDIEFSSLSRSHFNEILENLFIQKCWETQPKVFNENQDPSAKFDFLKEKIVLTSFVTRNNDFMGSTLACNLIKKIRRFLK